MKCRVCGEKFDVRGKIAVFQYPHKLSAKPRNTMMCGYCGMVVEKFIKDLEKDFSMFNEPLTKDKK